MNWRIVQGQRFLKEKLVKPNCFLKNNFFSNLSDIPCGSSFQSSSQKCHGCHFLGHFLSQLFVKKSKPSNSSNYVIVSKNSPHFVAAERRQLSICKTIIVDDQWTVEFCECVSVVCKGKKKSFPRSTWDVRANFFFVLRTSWTGLGNFCEARATVQMFVLLQFVFN